VATTAFKYFLRSFEYFSNARRLVSISEARSL